MWQGNTVELSSDGGLIEWHRYVIENCVFLIFIFHFGRQSTITIIIVRARKLPYKFLLPETKIMTIPFSFKYFDFSKVSQVC